MARRAMGRRLMVRAAAAGGGVGAAPTPRSSSQGSFTASASVATSFPTGWQVDDYALLWVHGGASAPLMNVKGVQSWERIIVLDDGSSDGAAAWFGRRLKTGDTAPTVALNAASDGTWGITAFTDVNTSRPWESRNATRLTVAGTSVAASIATLGPNRLLVSVVAHDPTGSGITATPPTGFTEQFEQVNGASSLVALATKGEAAAGTFSPSWSTSESDNKATAVLALVPSGGAANVVLKTDDASGSTAADVKALWGSIDAAAEARVTHFATGGPSNGPYRKISIVDGDVADGERAEIGRNEWRIGERQADTGALASWWATQHAFALYDEGSRRTTRFWMRLGSDFPLTTTNWNVVMQMKQVQPHPTSDIAFNSPILAMEVRSSQWQLYQSGDTLLASVAAVANVWVLHEFEILYHLDPAVGSLIWRMDTGGGLTQRYSANLKTLAKGTVDHTYFAVNQALPGHLRMGIYRNPVISGSTSVDIAEVEVSAPA